MYLKYKRPAIAMMELIFAIVIMGIVLMSAPMLISTATQSTSVALQQEGINEAVSRVSEILTYEWDQNDINDSCIPPTLHTSSGDDELKESNDSRRTGVPQESDFRTFKCGSTELNASTLGLEGSTKDDIDDFTNSTQVVEVATGSGGVDYIEQNTVNISTSIYYASDTADYNSKTVTYNFSPTSVSGTTNIKGITVTLTSSSSAQELNEKVIILHAFSCNIGGDITTGYKWKEIP